MILTLFLVPLHLVTRSIRWKYLLRPVKAGLRMSNAIEANTLGFTMNFIFPGRLGEVVRPVFLARREKLSPGYLIGTIVVERTFDMFAMCFLLGSFLISRPVYGSFYQARPEALPPSSFLGEDRTGSLCSALYPDHSGLFLESQSQRGNLFFFPPFPEK